MFGAIVPRAVTATEREELFGAADITTCQILSILTTLIFIFSHINRPFMIDWSRWDELINRLSREIENRIREALEYRFTMLEPTVGDYRRPRVDMTVKDGFVYIVVEMPGCDKEKIEVSVEENNLHVSGEYLSPSHTELLRLYPFNYGKGFRRTITLPRPVDPSRVEAKYDGGLLMVRAAIATPKGVRVTIE